MQVIGIDPGKIGGMAVASAKDIYEAYSFKNKQSNEIYVMLLAWVEKYKVNTAYVEDVHSMPYQSAQSGFTFGKELAKIETCLNIINIQIVKIAPAKWQRAMMCLTKGNKRITYDRAKKLFPNIKITHQIADACLIANYGAREKTPGLNYSLDEIMLRYCRKPGCIKKR